MNKTLWVALIAGLTGFILGALVSPFAIRTLSVETQKTNEEARQKAAPTPTWHKIANLGESWDNLTSDEREEDHSLDPNFSRYKQKEVHVSGDEWRISWKTTTIETDYGDHGLTIWVYDATDHACIETIRSSSNRDKDSQTFRGSGSYVIETACSRAFEVTVEEKS